MTPRPTVALGILGPILDRGEGPRRWDQWRPTVSLFQHSDLRIDRFELIAEPKFKAITKTVSADIKNVSPETDLSLREIQFDDPWDFEEVFGKLHAFAQSYPFEPEEEDYLIHITTGSHVQQICLFLLTESRHFPGRLIQTAPPKRGSSNAPGRQSVIDLDLSRYDKIVTRFEDEAAEALTFLKSGIATRNPAFNQLIEQVERVAIHSRAPMLLTGPTGAGKSQLARRVFELKKARHQFTGPFVEVNCATIRGDGAGSALFGHVKGAFTGAESSRKGHLLTANGGVLFLDEIGELGMDEQAMLLRAVEEKRFHPVGADNEVESDFQLIAGTNQDLYQAVSERRFREDLMARINLWTFKLPALKERLEDIEPNLDYELDQFTNQTGAKVSFNKEARQQFLRFATSPQAQWSGNFRDLNAAVYRMATLAAGKRIGSDIVKEEIKRLESDWQSKPESLTSESILPKLFDKEQREQLDLFDRAQLEFVLQIAKQSPTLSEAGRKLYAVSRQKRKDSNDADRLRKFLLRFDLNWRSIQTLRL